MTAESPRQAPEPISDLTAAARDTFLPNKAAEGAPSFERARSAAAAAAAARNLGGMSLAEQFAEYDAQQAAGELPPPPTDSQQ